MADIPEHRPEPVSELIEAPSPVVDALGLTSGIAPEAPAVSPIEPKGPEEEDRESHAPQGLGSMESVPVTGYPLKVTPGEANTALTPEILEVFPSMDVDPLIPPADDALPSVEVCNVRYGTVITD